MRYITLMMRRHKGHQDLAIYEVDQPKYVAKLQEMTESSSTYWTEVHEIKAEIELLSPHLRGPANVLDGVLFAHEFVLVDSGREGNSEAINDQFTEALNRLQVAMRADLGVPEPADLKEIER